MVVIAKVKTARTIVTAMFPVTFAPNGGGNGTRPKRLFISIKKNAVSR